MHKQKYSTQQSLFEDEKAWFEENHEAGWRKSQKKRQRNSKDLIRNKQVKGEREMTIDYIVNAAFVEKA